MARKFFDSLIGQKQQTPEFVDQASLLGNLRQGSETLNQMGVPGYGDNDPGARLSQFVPRSQPVPDFMDTFAHTSQQALENPDVAGSTLNNLLASQVQSAHNDKNTAYGLRNSLNQAALDRQGDVPSEVVLSQAGRVSVGSPELAAMGDKAGSLGDRYVSNYQDSMVSAVNHLHAQNQIDLVQPETWAKMATLDQGRILEATGYDPVAMGGGRDAVQMQNFAMSSGLANEASGPQSQFAARLPGTLPPAAPEVKAKLPEKKHKDGGILGIGEDLGSMLKKQADMIELPQEMLTNTAKDVVTGHPDKIAKDTIGKAWDENPFSNMVSKGAKAAETGKGFSGVGEAVVDAAPEAAETLAEEVGPELL